MVTTLWVLGDTVTIVSLLVEGAISKGYDWAGSTRTTGATFCETMKLLWELHLHSLGHNSFLIPQHIVTVGALLTVRE